MTTGLTRLPTLPQGACARFTDAVATAHAQDATTGVFPDPAPATTSGTGPATPASSRASRRTRRRNPPGMVGGTILVRSSPPARPPLRRPANRSHQPQHGTDGGRVIAERRPRPGQPRRDLSPNTSSTIHAEHDLNKTPRRPGCLPVPPTRSGGDTDPRPAVGFIDPHAAHRVKKRPIRAGAALARHPTTGRDPSAGAHQQLTQTLRCPRRRRPNRSMQPRSDADHHRHIPCPAG